MESDFTQGRLLLHMTGALPQTPRFFALRPTADMKQATPYKGMSPVPYGTLLVLGLLLSRALSPKRATSLYSGCFEMAMVKFYWEGRLLMRRWDNVVDRYMEVYSARGIAQATVAQVHRELDKWGLWMKHRRPKPQLDKIDSDLLLRYVQDRSAFRSKGTVSKVVSVMRSMGEFLVQEGFWLQNPFRWIRGPKLDPRSHLPRRISKKAMRQLWVSVATHRQGGQRLLWMTILSILYGAGIRRGELERLNVDHWNREEGILFVDGRKTGWERRVVLPDVARQCLESYLVQRHNYLEKLGCLDQKALFVNRDGSRLKAERISQGVRRIAERAGLEGITLHQFRHTCASDLLEAGLHVAHVQDILGHRAICSTARYLHISDPQRIAAVRLHPINDLLTRREDSHES